MVKKPKQSTARYSADMYKYDDGIDPKDLLNKKTKQGLFHNWFEAITDKR